MTPINKFEDFHGKVRWIHAVALNNFGRWSITLEPDQKALERIRELQAEGLKNTLRKDDDGVWSVNFHRDPNKTIRGKIITFAAPKVIGPDGLPMDGSKIGRGSDVTARVEVYRSGPKSMYKYVACRWDAVRVDSLVPFNVDRDMGKDEAEALKNLNAAAKPDWMSGWD
jgi:hypothetical protein